LGNGFARFDNEAVKSLETEKFKRLKGHLDSAQEQKLRIWKKYEKSTERVTQRLKEYTGVVQEIHSGDCLTVENISDGSV